MHMQHGAMHTYNLQPTLLYVLTVLLIYLR